VSHLNRLARALQGLLTDTAERLARETGFVQRRRKLTGATFAQALVFAFLADARASGSRIQATVAAVGPDIARQSLEARYTPRCAAFLKRLLAAAVAEMIGSPVAIPLLDRFTAVEVLDSSVVALPPELAGAYRGGRSGTTRGEPASVKLTVALDLKTGALRGPELADGRSADLAAAAAQADPVRGGLQLADLSYFSLEKFARWGGAGAYWLSRLKAQVAVADAHGQRLDLLRRLRAAKGQDLDLDVQLGAERRLACRLIARRAPAAAVRKRRQRLRDEARRRGEPVSARALALAAWTIVVTNVPRELLSVAEALELARMRWQIELVFKLWKGHGGIDAWPASRPCKALCQVYGKLLAVVVQHWTIVTGCWAEADRSPTKAARVVRDLALSLALALGRLASLRRVLGQAAALMRRACRMEHSEGRPNAHDRILAFGSSP
jgi:transposase InsO family protein